MSYTEVKVKIKNYYNSTTDGEPVHRLEFDEVVYDVIGSEITSREAIIFRGAILRERERIWDESANIVDDEVMKKLINM